MIDKSGFVEIFGAKFNYREIRDFMIVLNMLFVVLIVSMFATNDANAEKYEDNTRKIKCMGATEPNILLINHTGFDVLNYNMTLSVVQEFGYCSIKNIPWMPQKYIIELIDMEFNEIVDLREIIGLTVNNFEEEYNLFKEIPYCIKVTSKFLDIGNHFIDNRYYLETSSSECWMINDK